MKQLNIDHVLPEHPDQTFTVELESTVFGGHVFVIFFVLEQSLEDGPQQFLPVAPAHAVLVTRLAQGLAVGQNAQGFVGDKLGVGVQILWRRKLLFVASFNAVDGEGLHGANHVQQHEIQLLHLLRAVVQRLARAFDVSILVLKMAKKNVQDLILRWRRFSMVANCL